MNMKLCAIAVVAGLTSLALPSDASAQLCNAEAHRWVDSHREALPRTYQEFTRFPLNYRRAIYSVFDAKKRSELWQSQLELALQREDLTDNQRDVLMEAIQLATPEMFATIKNRQHWSHRQTKQNIAELEKRARLAFGNAKAGEIFGRIGPADLEVVRMHAEASPGLKLAGDFQQTAMAGCSCSDVSDYCNSAFNCGAGGCTTIRDECGTLWTYDCDGQCQINN
jgi:hypothetical protein